MHYILFTIHYLLSIIILTLYPFTPTQVRVNPNFKETVDDLAIVTSLRKLLLLPLDLTPPSNLTTTEHTSQLTSSKVIIKNVYNITPRGVWNARDCTISWSSMSGTATPGAAVDCEARIEVARDASSSTPPTTTTTSPSTTSTNTEPTAVGTAAATVVATGASGTAAAGSSVLSPVDLQHLASHCPSPPTIVKGRYKGSLVTKTRFNIHKIDTQRTINHSNLQANLAYTAVEEVEEEVVGKVEESFSTVLEYRYL